MQPLQNVQWPEMDDSFVARHGIYTSALTMDHSFVGLSGGEIFHEMMLRQGVKHICQSLLQVRIIEAKETKHQQLATLEERFYPFLTPSTTPSTLILFFHDMSKEQDTWLRVMQGHQANQE